MEPIKKDKREAFHGGPEVSVANINDSGLNMIEDFFEPLATEDGEMSFLANKDASVKENSMTDEDIKVKALSLAINIAKLMSDVTTDDVLKIAGTVAKYIKG